MGGKDPYRTAGGAHLSRQNEEEAPLGDSDPTASHAGVKSRAYENNTQYENASRDIAPHPEKTDDGSRAPDTAETGKQATGGVGGGGYRGRWGFANASWRDRGRTR